MPKGDAPGAADECRLSTYCGHAAGAYFRVVVENLRLAMTAYRQLTSGIADMTFTQLDPPIPLTVQERGDGFAIAVIDYGQEFDLLWVVGMDDGGEIWCVPNPQVRLRTNWSMGRQKKGKQVPKIASI